MPDSLTIENFINPKCKLLKINFQDKADKLVSGFQGGQHGGQNGQRGSQGGQYGQHTKVHKLDSKVTRSYIMAKKHGLSKHKNRTYTTSISR